MRPELATAPVEDERQRAILCPWEQDRAVFLFVASRPSWTIIAILENDFHH
jgi:hypothetical protein